MKPGVEEKIRGQNSVCDGLLGANFDKWPFPLRLFYYILYYICRGLKKYFFLQKAKKKKQVSAIILHENY
jgi:hypothetical protein